MGGGGWGGGGGGGGGEGGAVVEGDLYEWHIVKASSSFMKIMTVFKIESSAA